MPNAQTAQAQEERSTRQASRQQGQRMMTHRIQILKASHFLNDDGVYDCDLVFWEDFDFQRAGSLDSKKDAVMVLDKLMSTCLRMTDPFALEEEDWKHKVEQMWHHVQGGQLDTEASSQAKLGEVYVRGQRVRTKPHTTRKS